MNIHFNGNILYIILVKMPQVTFQFVCIPRLVDQACRGCRCIVLGAGALCSSVVGLVTSRRPSLQCGVRLAGRYNQHSHVHSSDSLLTHMGGTPVNSLTHVFHTNNADDILDDNLDITDSLYYNYNQFHRLLQPNKNNFSILSSNIQSLHAKFNELEAFVTDLQSNKFEFSIICLQESWLSEHDDT